MSTITQRAGGVLAAAVLVLGVSGCSKAATTTAAATTPSTVSSVVAASESASAGSGAASASPTDSATASVSAAAPVGDCKKVRFALHTGLGAGAVHRYLWKPYQAGTFAASAKGQKTAIVKGALAGAFALHEFKVAIKDIAGCSGTQSLTAAIQSGLDKAGALVTGLKAGKIDPTALAGVNDQLASIEGQSKAAGITVTESDPSAIQLATGNTGD